ncbi:tripartite tricarboxylate transporter substrate binding protein [Xenophilus azovorans]|uniref:Bug family tripartite tricarboxylate transporter substrate binding protein n=1 Tax=Xenophilus TaxID=151754 RepID=UPI00068AF51D|nr:tripartite tricarboxylate transporter substrate-binding protein [Xenophilus azovorans]
MTTRRAVLQGAFGAAAAALARTAPAQADTTPITVLVGAASSMDFTARLVAEQMHEALGRPAVVLSKLGAGQRLALGEVKRSAPDGRTLVFATSGPFAIYPHIYNRLDYDPVADFTPIAGISKFDVAVATGPMTGATTLKELIAWQKTRKRGDAVFGSAPGNGSLSHFLGLSISLATGVPMTHVAYKDSGVGIIDLASSRLPMMITGLSPLVEMHRAGKVRLLAVSGSVRSPLVPEVPTLQEAGVNVSSSTSTGLFGPPRMPADLVARLHDAVVPMLGNAAILDKLAGQAMTPWAATPKELAAALAQEREHFAGLVKASGYVREDA